MDPSFTRRGVFRGPGGETPGGRCGWPVPALGHPSSRRLFLCPRVSPGLVLASRDNIRLVPSSDSVPEGCPGPHRVARAEGLVGEPTGPGSSLKV